MKNRGVRATAVVVFVLALLLSFIGRVEADIYYIAAGGADVADGSFDDPFGSFEQAIDAAAAGDTIYVRGGDYMLETCVTIDKSGGEDNPIRLWAYGGETPVLDFSNNPRHDNPPQPREDDSAEATGDALGIYVAGGGDWWHIRGLVIRNAPYYGVRVYGSHNVFERLTLTDNQASGLEITGKDEAVPSFNLVLNCDSYLNFDPQTNGEDADGFAAKFETLGPGNVFRGLRAWSNSDDGYDFWHADQPVLIENCWAFDNGFFRPEWEDEVHGRWRGDGLGYKLGAEAAELVLYKVVAFGNKAHGINDNGNQSENGVVIYNATLVNNAKDGNPLQIQLQDGRPHTVRNTIAFDVDGAGVSNLSREVDNAYNTWNGVDVSEADFVNIDLEQLYASATAPRNPDGSLPDIGLRLDPDSRLIDAGIDVGLPFMGEAPDLGAFEHIPENAVAPHLTIPEDPIMCAVYPNPFNSITAIRFDLPAASTVRLQIYDAAGNPVRTLTDEKKAAGGHTVVWDGLNKNGQAVSSGMYFYRLDAAQAHRTAGRMVLLE